MFWYSILKFIHRCGYFKYLNLKQIEYTCKEERWTPTDQLLLDKKADLSNSQFEDFQYQLAHRMVSERVRRLMLGYAKAINKQESLKGSLFRKYFRRKVVDNQSYLRQLMLYIHLNPKHHGIVTNISDWPWSSYPHLVYNFPNSFVNKDGVGWFGGKIKFMEFHNI